MTGTVRATLTSWVRAWGPATLWLAVLFVLSDQPGDAVPSWWSVPDVVAHTVLYTVLGVLLVLGRHWNGGRPGWFVLAGAGLLFAALDEWHQSWVPGRTPSSGDVAADALGLLIGGVTAGFALAFLSSDPDGARRASSERRS